MAESNEPQKWSNAADEIIRKEFLKSGRDKCIDKVKAFVECSKENGLMVIFKCRDQNREMNDCVSQHTSNEQWIQFREEKVKAFEKAGQIAKTDLKPKNLA